MIEKGANINGKNLDEESPLIVAAKRGDLHLVKLLVKRGANLGNINELLVEASEIGSLKLTKFWLEKGADINHKIGGWSSLTYALNYDYKKIAKFLVKNGVDVNMLDDENLSPLAHALETENLNIAALMIKKGANVNTLIDNENNTPLIFASEYFKLAKLLIQSGADVNTVNDKNDSALDIAIRNDEKEIVQLILDTVLHLIIEIHNENFNRMEIL